MASVYTAFDTPDVSAITYAGKTEMTWPNISPITWSGVTRNPTYYGIRYGGTLEWECLNCGTSANSASELPQECPYCHETDFFSWSLKNPEAQTQVVWTATRPSSSYTRKSVSNSTTWIYAYGQGSTGRPSLWSRPVRVVSSYTGSYFSTTGSVSLVTASALIGNKDTGYVGDGEISLIHTVYNDNLNPYSRHLPGESRNSQSAQAKSYEHSYDLRQALVSGSTKWIIKNTDPHLPGGESEDYRESSLKTYQSYTDYYESGVSGSYWFFPWGVLGFNGGDLDPVWGIRTAEVKSGSFGLTLMGNIVGYKCRQAINSYGRRMIDGPLNIQSKTYYTYDFTLATSPYWYPGLVIWDHDDEYLTFNRSNTPLGSLNLSTYSMVQVLTGSIEDKASNGDRIYPVLVYRPESRYPANSWTRTIADYDESKFMAERIITFDGNYLPISV